MEMKMENDKNVFTHEDLYPILNSSKCFFAHDDKSIKDDLNQYLHKYIPSLYKFNEQDELSDNNLLIEFDTWSIGEQFIDLFNYYLNIRKLNNKTSFILQLVDLEDNIIQESELIIDNGDILICKLLEKASESVIRSISNTVERFFNAKIKDRPKALILPYNIELSVLKIGNGDNK
jgi:hypothetical protein